MINEYDWLMNISRDTIGRWIYPGIWLVDENKEYDWLMNLSRNMIGSWIYLGILLFDKYVFFRDMIGWMSTMEILWSHY